MAMATTSHQCPCRLEEGERFWVPLPEALGLDAWPTPEFCRHPPLCPQSTAVNSSDSLVRSDAVEARARDSDYRVRWRRAHMLRAVHANEHCLDSGKETVMCRSSSHQPLAGGSLQSHNSCGTQGFPKVNRRRFHYCSRYGVSRVLPRLVASGSGAARPLTMT